MYTPPSCTGGLSSLYHRWVVRRYLSCPLELYCGGEPIIGSRARRTRCIEYFRARESSRPGPLPASSHPLLPFSFCICTYVYVYVFCTSISSPVPYAPVSNYHPRPSFSDPRAISLISFLLDPPPALPSPPPPPHRSLHFYSPSYTFRLVFSTPASTKTFLATSLSRGDQILFSRFVLTVRAPGAERFSLARLTPLRSRPLHARRTHAASSNCVNRLIDDRTGEKNHFAR